MGGYLDYYGIRDWYDGLSPESRDYLYMSCGRGVNCCSDNLLYGEHIRTDSAVEFLCGHALSAVRDRFHDLCDTYMDKAFSLCGGEDAAYKMYAQIIIEEKKVYPDHLVIESYKPIIYQLIKDNPGIIQAHIKRNFPVDLEQIIGLAYWKIYQEGLVRREKKGSSFKLFISGEAQEEL